VNPRGFSHAGAATTVMAITIGRRRRASRAVLLLAPTLIQIARRTLQSLRIIFWRIFRIRIAC
jgi:hypothetical protein